MPAEPKPRNNLRQATLFGKPAARSSSKTQRVHTDAILAIKTKFVDCIATREKNHEYRKYQLRDSVQRIWLYETSPAQAIRYVMSTAKPKTPGQVKDSTGMGNDDFDAGKKESKYGYPVTGLWKLKTPITAQMLQEYGVQPPMGYGYLSEKLVDEVKIDEMEKIF